MTVGGWSILSCDPHERQTQMRCSAQSRCCLFLYRGHNFTNGGCEAACLQAAFLALPPDEEACERWIFNPCGLYSFEPSLSVRKKRKLIQARVTERSINLVRFEFFLTSANSAPCDSRVHVCRVHFSPSWTGSSVSLSSENEP